MVKNIIIFGSNFGSTVHVKAVKKLKSSLKISICSPNINKKKIDISNLKKFDNYKEALKKKYNAGGVATTPDIQSRICNYIIKKKNRIKFILLEKPIACNFNETKKIIKGLIKRKINFLVNFIFENISGFKELKKILKKKKIIYAKYEWTFQQMYFKNKIKTWKTNYLDGGGLVNYYLIHVFYNLYLFFDDLKIIKIESKKNKNLVTKIDLLISDSAKKKILVHMNINSIIKKHSLIFITENETYNLVNTSKDWVKNFNLYKNGKKINFKNKKKNRENLTAENYNKLFMSKYLKKDIVDKIIKSHKLCDEVIRKIYN